MIALRLAAIVAAIFFCCAHSVFAQDQNNRHYCLDTGRIRLFLIDITTEYDPTDKRSITSMIEKVLDSAQGGDLVIARTISDTHTKSERIIERCIPQCIADSWRDKLFKCSDGRLRTDTGTVRRDVLEALRSRLQKFEETKFSDIIRTLNAVASEEARPGRSFSLYIYSDLIENSDGLIPTRNFFKYQIPFLIENLQKYRLVPLMKGYEVHIAGVGRAGTADRKPLPLNELNFLIAFWNTYFKTAGAESISISQNATAP